MERIPAWEAPAASGGFEDRSGRLGRTVVRAAALGLLFSACEKKPEPPAESAAPSAVTAGGMGTPSSDKNCCMGKNECKGQGQCAVAESHACAGKNECKGQGGCNMHCPK